MEAILQKYDPRNLETFFRNPEDCPDGNLFFTRVTTRDLFPWIENGDFVVCRRQSHVDHGCSHLYVVRLHGAKFVEYRRIIADPAWGMGVLKIVRPVDQASAQIIEHIKGELYRESKFGVDFNLQIVGRIVYPRDAESIHRWITDMGRRVIENPKEDRGF